MFHDKKENRIEVAIATKDRKHIAEEMRKFMAETYSLYLMTQNFHWNVTGILFHSLHLLFEKQYLELAQAVDVIAERIRALGFNAPGSFREFSALSTLRDEIELPEAEEMVHLLMEAHSSVAQHAHHISTMSTEAEDASTADLMADRVTEHEKAIWMLQSIISSTHPAQR